MELTTHGSTITIKGNLRDIQDIQQLGRALDEMSAESFTLEMRGVTVLTSAVIGKLVKLHNVDKKHIAIRTDSPHMIELLNRLSLNQAFDIQRI